MSRKRMEKCLALCALALTVCVGIAVETFPTEKRAGISFGNTVGGIARRVCLQKDIVFFESPHDIGEYQIAFMFLSCDLL